MFILLLVNNFYRLCGSVKSYWKNLVSDFRGSCLPSLHNYGVHYRNVVPEPFLKFMCVLQCKRCIHLGFLALVLYFTGKFLSWETILFVVNYQPVSLTMDRLTDNDAIIPCRGTWKCVKMTIHQLSDSPIVHYMYTRMTLYSTLCMVVQDCSSLSVVKNLYF